MFGRCLFSSQRDYLLIYRSKQSDNVKIHKHWGRNGAISLESHTAALFDHCWYPGYKFNFIFKVLVSIVSICYDIVLSTHCIDHCCRLWHFSSKWDQLWKKWAAARRRPQENQPHRIPDAPGVECFFYCLNCIMVKKMPILNVLFAKRKG